MGKTEDDRTLQRLNAAKKWLINDDARKAQRARAAQEAEVERLFLNGEEPTPPEKDTQ